LGTGSLLSREMQAERLKWVTYAENRRYGLGIGYDNGWLGHIGALPGYNTSVFYLPEKDAALVVLTNSDIAANDDNPAPAIFKALTRVVTPDNVPQSK